MPGMPPQAWEVKYSFGYTYAAKLIYDIVGTTGVYTATIYVYSTENDSEWTISLGACTAEGLTLTVTDPPGTVHDIPAGQAQEQADTLRGLCDKTNSASCEFAATSEIKTSTPSHPVGLPFANCTEKEQETAYEAEDKVGQSNSVGVALEAGVKIFDIVDTSITTTYDHQWTQEHVFTQSETLRVDPGHLAWVSSTAPIYRDTGDFTLKLGNTTWELRGVYFDTPDPTRAGRFVADDAKLSPNDYKAICTHVPPGSSGLVRVSASYIPTGRSRPRHHG